MAFSDNRDWSSCYCAFYNVAGSQEAWGRRTAAENLALKASLIAEGRTNGVLAYDESGRVAGWVHADRRLHLPRLDGWGVPKDAAAGAVVCFVVRPDLRRRGVARQLLAAACSRLADLGCDHVDCWPVTKVRKHPTLSRDAVDYHGPLQMYLDAGFEVVERDDAHNFTHVRKRLD